MSTSALAGNTHTLTMIITPADDADNAPYVRRSGDAAGQDHETAVTPFSLAAILSTTATGPETWQEQALCAQTDPEAFYPEKGGSTREAKRICSGCNVRAECLEYALGNDERFGIWGGLSERERRRIRRLG